MTKKVKETDRRTDRLPLVILSAAVAAKNGAVRPRTLLGYFMVFFCLKRLFTEFTWLVQKTVSSLGKQFNVSGFHFTIPVAASIDLMLDWFKMVTVTVKVSLAYSIIYDNK